MRKRLVGSVTVHVFEVEDAAGQKRVEIAPLIFIERQGDDFRLVAGALSTVARGVREQASPLVFPGLPS